ncbi:MAG: alkaline phosphatase family protein, partial [Candidatus Aenigmatarchaeota archaeon]
MWKKLSLLILLIFIMSPTPVEADDPSQRKVLVIGLDGADWDIMKPLLEDNKLPNIERVMEKGDSSNITSSIPSMSPVAWTTFAT